MGLAPFFERVHTAVGHHLGVTRASLESTLSGVRVGIVVRDAHTANEANIAEMALNIVARLYPSICLQVPSAELSEKLRTLAHDINPEIEIVSSAAEDLTIFVGWSSSNAGIHAASSGWVARTGFSLTRVDGPPNPYAAAASAALACGELFRRVFLKKSSSDSFSISLLDFSAEAGSSIALADASIGDVLFVGVGAVGNAALWTIGRDERTTGTLTFVDHEDVALSNLQRYVLCTFADVGRSKTDVALRELATSRFSASGIKTTLEAYTPVGEQAPTSCVSLDNVEGRRVVQALLPRLVVNGWTGDGSLGASWHTFADERACLACLYHPQGQGLSAVQQAAKAFGLSETRALQLWAGRQPLTGDERRRAATKLGVSSTVLGSWKSKPIADLYSEFVCGSAAIELSGPKHVEVVPLAHQSVLAGVLMAAELLKRMQPGLAAQAQSDTLVVVDDVLRKPPVRWTRPRAKERGCICGDAIYREVYELKWRASTTPVSPTLTYPLGH